MSDATHAYLCNQLHAALSDSPGGEKAWVPLRRSTVLACIEALEDASSAVVLMDELRALLNRAQWGAESAQDSSPQDTQLPPFTVGPPLSGAADRDEWNTLTPNQRVVLIRYALDGERIGWLPDPRTWARHYPAAFAASNNGAAAHA